MFFFFREFNISRGSTSLEWLHPQRYLGDKREKSSADSFINLIKQVKNTHTFSYCLLVIWCRLQMCWWRPQIGKQRGYKFWRSLSGFSDWLRLSTISEVNFRFQYKEQWKIWGSQGITWNCSTRRARILIAVSGRLPDVCCNTVLCLLEVFCMWLSLCKISK